MTTQYVIFAVLAAVTIISAYKVVTARLITHAALFLVLSFTGVAGVYLQMQQEFVAAIQVLIYAGAITTMIIFAIMLSEIRDIKLELEQGRSVRRFVRRSAPLAFVVAAAFAAMMTYLYMGAGLSEPVGSFVVEQTRAIGLELFTTYVVPFEVASILLLAAMIGAIILTAKEEADR